MPMKVTVCFDKVKVLVPCGDGELLVRELIEKAITRYKKAIGEPCNYWVRVLTLRTVKEDSILDTDDTVSDVIDDREQLIADFEEQGEPRSHHNGGDGQSVSSTETPNPALIGGGLSVSSTRTASPDVCNHVTSHKSRNGHHRRGFSFDGNDVIVTDIDISAGSGLTVRRESEPNLNVLDGEELRSPSSDLSPNNNNSNKKDNTDPTSKDDSHKPIIKGTPLGPKEREKTPPFGRFARDSWRQSLGTQPSVFKWLEAQERQEERIKNPPERQGPVGGSTIHGDDDVEGGTKPPLPHAKKEIGILICLKNDGTPLGIHVVPDFDESGRESGLLVQGIDAGGRIDQDGRLKEEDRIIEINSHDLHNITFPKAQEIFRNAMKTEEVRLKVVKHAQPKKPPPAVLPKPRGHSPSKPSPLTLLPQKLEFSPADDSVETSTPLNKNSNSNKTNQSEQPSSNSKNSQPISGGSPVKAPPTGKKAPPPAPPQRHPSTTLSSNSQTDLDAPDSDKKDNTNRSGTSSPSPSATGTLTKNREVIIAPTNTKKIGKRYEIKLVKGPVGLGFSITTRDNATGGPSPIYIKNILPEGAAVTDGRLKAGDRLLEVNDVEMLGKTHGEAVAMFRNLSLGSTVKIAVSRQEVEDPKNDSLKLPRVIPSSDLDPADNDLENDHQILQPPEKTGDDGTLGVMKNKELLEFNIPLNNTGSAGLGVSVKGKTLTTEEGTQDLGIFVKAVIHGGAASKDGRLLVNDQLLEVNDVSLINHSNTEAMDLVRNAMQIEGPVPGCINIIVARRVGVTSPSSRSFDGADWGNSAGERELNNNDSKDTTDHGNEDSFKSPSKVHNGDIPSNFKSPNLFLDRVMAGNGLRNESYTRATHESFAGTPEPIRKRDNLIDLTKQRPRPHSTIGIERVSPHGSNSSSSEDLNKEPAWIHGPDWTRHASQTSEESELAGDGFSRDGFGRQSMSEKRKGHSDPRSSEVYQKVRGLKELNKANIRGPPSNLKRFSSLENLTTMQDPDAGQDLDMSESFDDEDASPRPHMARRRGGNESFRAAVDRSYDPVPKLDMDPLEEEGSEGGSLGRDLQNSARSSSTSEVYTDEKKKAAKKHKEARRSGGILKGFFKFGKGRKTPVDELGKGGTKSEEHRADNVDGEGSAHREHIEQEELKWRQAQAEQERAQQEYRRVQEQHYFDQQQQQQQQQMGDNRRSPAQFGGQYAFKPPEQHNMGHYAFKPPEPHSMGHSAPVMSNSDLHRDQPVNRAERIQQLRADHQRRHLERHGHYPSEDREEEYERQIQEEERRGRSRFTSDQEYFFYQKYGQSAIPSQIDSLQEQQGQRSRPASRNQAERPNSRVGPPSGDYMMQGTNLVRVARGPTPTHEGHSQYSMGHPAQRGQTPSNEQERMFSRNNSTPNYGNYQVIHKTQTPQNVNYGDKVWNYSDDSDLRKGNVNINRTNMNLTQDSVPPGGGWSHGNSYNAYRDPVFSMAGKRPVKSLSQQPNSAKV